jgi:hypothetical protein
VWQAFYERHRTNEFELLSVAVDVQGASVVKPFVDKFRVSFPVAVDISDVFGERFGLKVVPVSFFIDELGIIRLAGGGPTTEFLNKIKSILEEPLSLSAPAQNPAKETGRLSESKPPDDSSSIANYVRMGHLLLQQGRTNEAAAKLRQALKLDPSNWRIRKQIWAVENPDKFYSADKPDFSWQSEQIKREESAARAPSE